MINNEKGIITIGHLIGTFVAAVVATLIIGFSWGGWVTESSAQSMVDKSTELAVTERLGEICIAQAQETDGIQAQIVELEKVASYARGKAVMEKDWAIMPGDDSADTAVAKACASGLISA